MIGWRISIRARLTAAFAVALLVVFGLAGAFVYARVSSTLNESLDEGLRSRADALVSLVAGSGSAQPTLDGARLGDSEEGFSQILTPSGRLVASDLAAADAATITPAEAGDTSAGPVLIQERAVPGIDGSSRILALPAASAEGRYVVVAGATTEDRREALDGIAGAFLIGAPLAVLAASGTGYLLARRSLRPVEAMRARAAEIGGERSDERLPLPEADDELRRLGVTLNAMLDRLGEAIERQRELVADAGHELRTPLSVLRAELELADSGERTPGELRAAVRAGVREVDRLSRLADDLLLIASSEGGRLPIHPERVRIGKLLERVAKHFEGPAREECRDVAVDAEAGLEADLDPLRLEQAVGNLVDNALRHGEGTVLIAARPSEGGLSIEVSDEGSGFPEGFEGAAFKRFTRPDEGRGGPGAGLGLAIVRAIAEAHGGEASIVPTSDRTTVRLKLPRSPDAALIEPA